MILICGLLMLVLTSCIQRVTYTITWANHNGSFLEVDLKVLEGDVPTYDGATPTRLATETESFQFLGWQPEIVAATENQTYTAQYQSIPRSDLGTFTIIWMNNDGTILETDYSVSLNTIPTYDGETPTKASDSSYRYEFNGWTPAIIPAQADTVYIAQYTNHPIEAVITYIISWLNYDGSTLAVSPNLEVGAIPSYPGETPLKPTDSNLTYHFAGWTPSVVSVTGNASYIATFTTKPICFTVSWLNYDLNLLQENDSVVIGTMPNYSGSVPERADDDDYSYVFAGWSPVLSPVYGNISYTALYTSIPLTYTITWINYNTSVLETDTLVAKLASPLYDGLVPTRPDEIEYGYDFIGWSPTLSLVTGNQIYTAQFEETNLIYELSADQEQDDSYAVIGYRAHPTQIVVPETYRGLPVKRIVSLQDCLTLKSLVISTQISDITIGALKGCSLLEKITVPFFGINGLTINEDDSQFGAIFGEISYSGSIPFVQNTSTSSNTWYIPNNLEIISLAVSNFSTIQEYSLNGITGRLYIPQSVQSHESAFKYFNGYLYLESASLWIDQEDDFLFNTVNTVYVNVKALDKNNDYLYRTTISNEVFLDKYLGDSTSLTLPSTIESNPVVGIGSLAFSAKDLVNVIFSNSIQIIERGAFSDNNLISITIPSSVLSIGSLAFTNNPNLTNITIPFLGSDREETDSTFLSDYFDITSLETISVLSGYSQIPSYAFTLLESLTTLSFADPITSIGISAFEGCTSLGTFNLANTVTKLGKRAFFGCSELEEITLNSLLTIGEQSFSNCIGLISLSFPNVITISERAFEGCSNLDSITLENLLTLGNYAFNQCRLLTNIAFHSVSKIGDYAFLGCSKMTEIIFPQTLTEIGSYAFLSGYLTSIVLDDNLEKIGKLAFCGQRNLISAVIGGTNLTIGDNAFEGCTILSALTFTGSITSIGKKSFYNCPSLTSLVLPSTLKSIGEEGFRGCIALTYLVIMNNDLKLGKDSFTQTSTILN
ncbi:MAG: hypothetical protein EZS28_027533, partial [Streblomastix strix]